MKRLDELNTLRNELLQNKKFVFERPILILSATGVAFAQISKNGLFHISIIILSFVVILLLLLNLQFTINRIKSIARISAYILLFLEPVRLLKWIGWENSLRIYRRWQKENSISQRYNLKEFIDKTELPESMMFYSLIFFIHFIPVILILGAVIFVLSKQTEIIEISISIVTIILGFIFLFKCIKDYRPNKQRDLIERARIVWLLSFMEKKMIRKSQKEDEIFAKITKAQSSR